MTQPADRTARRSFLSGLPSFRPPNGLLLLAGGIGFALVSWLMLQGEGGAPVRFRIDATRFVEASAMVKLHLLGAVTAFGTGAVLLRGVKGTGLHRKLGYTWVVAMGITAISSFFLVGLNGNHYSLIHGLSARTVIALPMGVAAARRRNIRAHSKTMTGMFTGGLVLAGLFAFLPGRLLWSIFFTV